MPDPIMITAEVGGKVETHSMSEWSRISCVSVSQISKNYRDNASGKRKLTPRQIVCLDQIPDAIPLPHVVLHGFRDMSRRRLVNV